MNDCLAAVGFVVAANQQAHLRQILGHHADRALAEQHSSRQPPRRHRPEQKQMLQHSVLAPAEPVTRALVVQQLIQRIECPLQASVKRQRAYSLVSLRFRHFKPSKNQKVAAKSLFTVVSRPKLYIRVKYEKDRGGGTFSCGLR